MGSPAPRRGRAARPGRRARPPRAGSRPRRGAARCRRGCRGPARGAAGRRRGRSRPTRSMRGRRPPRASREAARDGLEQLTGLNGLAAERQAPVVGSCKHEEVLGQADESVGLACAERRASSSSASVRGLPEGELELGLQERERRAELVARVGDEAPLSLDRALQPRRASRSASRRAARSRPARGRSGRRRPGSDAEIAAASARISSTGRRAAPASQYPSSDASSRAIGPAIEELEREHPATSRPGRRATAPTTRRAATRSGASTATPRISGRGRSSVERTRRAPSSARAHRAESVISVKRLVAHRDAGGARPRRASAHCVGRVAPTDDSSTLSSKADSSRK